MSLSEAVATGDLRTSLEAIRDHLADELEQGCACVKCGGSVSSPTAAIAKQLADVIARIERLPTKEASAVDDLAAQRRRRKSGARDASAQG